MLTLFWPMYEYTSWKDVAKTNILVQMLVLHLPADMSPKRDQAIPQRKHRESLFDFNRKLISGFSCFVRSTSNSLQRHRLRSQYVRNKLYLFLFNFSGIISSVGFSSYWWVRETELEDRFVTRCLHYYGFLFDYQISFNQKARILIREQNIC